MTPYGGNDVGQHWLRSWLYAWWQQAITWTNVVLPPLTCIDIHPRAIPQKIPEPFVSKLDNYFFQMSFRSPESQWVNRGDNTVIFVVNKLLVPIMLMAWLLGLQTQYQSVYWLWLRYIHMWRFATGYSFRRRPCLTHSVVFDSKIRMFMTLKRKMAIGNQLI